MAKRCMVERNNKRKKLSSRDYVARQKLKSIIRSQDTSLEEKFSAQKKLEKMARDGSKTRIRNRCMVTGRPRGNFSKFNLSRCKLLEYFSLGLIPGLRKASW